MKFAVQSVVIVVHRQVLSALQLSTIVVMAVGARLPQIWLNVKRGNAGVLSPLTCLLNVAGCVVRVFTTAVLTVRTREGEVRLAGGHRRGLQHVSTGNNMVPVSPHWGLTLIGP
jgi:hypothetical protein